jgi:hypothetical protein
MLAVCLCIPPPHQLLNAQPVFMKLGMLIMTPEHISAAYFVKPSHQSVCPNVYPAIVARQRLGNNPVFARQRLGKNVTAATNTHATVELLDAFSMLPGRIKESRRLVLPRTS